MNWPTQPQKMPKKSFNFPNFVADLRHLAFQNLQTEKETKNEKGRITGLNWDERLK